MKCKCKKDWTIKDAVMGDRLRYRSNSNRYIRTGLPFLSDGSVVCIDDGTAMYADTGGWRPDDREEGWTIEDAVAGDRLLNKLMPRRRFMRSTIPLGGRGAVFCLDDGEDYAVVVPENWAPGGEA